MPDVTKLPTAANEQVDVGLLEDAHGDVTTLPIRTRHFIPPDRVFHAAREQDVRAVVVVGIREDGTRFMIASERAPEKVLWELERAKMMTLRGGK